VYLEFTRNLSFLLSFFLIYIYILFYQRDYPESIIKPEPIERFSAQATNVSMNVDVKEESKLGASFRYRGKSRVGRRFATGRAK
jgi:hypothetical protein